jgi:hypothetical protein
MICRTFAVPNPSLDIGSQTQQNSTNRGLVGCLSYPNQILAVVSQTEHNSNTNHG